MKKIIHNLRQQPEHVRRHILHGVTIVAALVLISFWVFSLGANFGNPETQAKISEELKPFSVIKHDIVNGYQNIAQPQAGTAVNAQE